MMRPGATIGGRYRLTRHLGAGAMGSVWLADDTALDRQVAMKWVRGPLVEGSTSSTDGAQRAMREARVLARVNHAHAVAIYDVVQHEGGPWLVMEYVPSQNLSEVVTERGPLAPRHAAELGAQVAAALAAVHRAGIVHRDVKPANVLISEHRTAKITDFGIARGAEDATLTATGMMWGTPAYFAPEVAGGAQPTEKADVWALAATLYFAVEGAPPHGTEPSPLVLLGRIANQPVPPPYRAGPLTPVLDRLLDRDPNSRPTMVEAVGLLRDVAPETPVDDSTAAPAMSPEGAPEGTGQTAATVVASGPSASAGRTRRSRALPVLLVLLALAAVAGVGWWLLGLGGADESGGAAADPSPPPASVSPSEQPSQPSDEPSATQTPDLFTAPAMERAVSDYYALLPNDTETGFERLGPELKSQGFASYRDFWGGIESVRVQDLQANPADRSVTGTVVFVTSDGRTSTERHRFGLVTDGDNDQVLINTDDHLG